jgi:hypothetical protein
VCDGPFKRTVSEGEILGTSLDEGNVARSLRLVARTRYRKHLSRRVEAYDAAAVLGDEHRTQAACSAADFEHPASLDVALPYQGLKYSPPKIVRWAESIVIARNVVEVRSTDHAFRTC